MRQHIGRSRSWPPFRRLSLSLLLFAAATAAEVSFNRDIRPVMSDTCFRCHGPDKNARMAGLRLDIREEALKKTASGAVPIVPGKPEASAMVERVFAEGARIMPPKYAHKELTAAQKELIRRWVAEGARYEGHWAYTPVRRPEPPKVAAPRAPLRNPVDAFIQARLAKEGLGPSPEADRRTLVRRVTLDLTGIPPAPSEVEAFVSDRSPGAYERVLDRLLRSPRYAEKQAMHWLDAVRYADTCGFHGDNAFPAWPYRDYVLKAFRDNKPFDQFTREQIAGDLIPNATPGQKVASAYNRLSRSSAEGGLQPKEYLAKYAADRVRTTSAVWLGSTLGCAECHDHKFDPFTARDFYSMKAFFADILETGLVPDRGPRAWGAQLALPAEEQQRRRERLSWQMAEARRSLEQETLGLIGVDERWEKRVLERFENGELAWQFQRPLSASSERGARLAVFNDEPVESNYWVGGSLVVERKPGSGMVVAGGPNPDNETYTVTFRPGEGTWTALGLEVVQEETLPGTRFARGADRFVLSEVEAELSSAAGQPAGKLAFSLAASNMTIPAPEYPAIAAVDGDPKTGWSVFSYTEVGDMFLAMRFRDKVRTGAGSVLTVRLRHDSGYRRATIGRFRLALAATAHSWPEPALRKRPSDGKAAILKAGLPERLVKALESAPDARTEEQRAALLEYYAWSTPELAPRLEQIARLEAEQGALEASIPRVLATQSTRPRVTRILRRGNWMDESGEIVEPAVPGFLGKLDTGGRRASRLDLANWIGSRDNPLTARVFVNRTWRQFFGAGLS
ncbi:MAG: DUF1549 domain-containing protein, partial [Acidobacteria bacterium]|nr:DUF1549 domain-containing protein [Acidobacteriota bacterium]